MQEAFSQDPVVGPEHAMMRGIDFTSWPTVLSTLLGLSIVTLVMVGLRLVAMQTVRKQR